MLVLSTCEGEYVAMCSAAARGIWVANIYKALAIEMGVNVNSDSSVARGLAHK